VQVHVTNFDYNQNLLNTMPGTRLASRARAAARGGVSSALRRARHQRHPRDQAAAQGVRLSAVFGYNLLVISAVLMIRVLFARGRRGQSPRSVRERA